MEIGVTYTSSRQTHNLTLTLSINLLPSRFPKHCYSSSFIHIKIHYALMAYGWWLPRVAQFQPKWMEATTTRSHRCIIIIIVLQSIRAKGWKGSEATTTNNKETQKNLWWSFLNDGILKMLVPGSFNLNIFLASIIYSLLKRERTTGDSWFWYVAISSTFKGSRIRIKALKWEIRSFTLILLFVSSARFSTLTNPLFL